jgi:hypothetical protein
MAHRTFKRWNFITRPRQRNILHGFKRIQSHLWISRSFFERIWRVKIKCFFLTLRIDNFIDWRENVNINYILNNMVTKNGYLQFIIYKMVEFSLPLWILNCVFGKITKLITNVIIWSGISMIKTFRFKNK